jgi:hypothetical protein
MWSRLAGLSRPVILTKQVFADGMALELCLWVKSFSATRFTSSSPRKGKYHRRPVAPFQEPQSCVKMETWLSEGMIWLRLLRMIFGSRVAKCDCLVRVAFLAGYWRFCTGPLQQAWRWARMW